MKNANQDLNRLQRQMCYCLQSVGRAIWEIRVQAQRSTEIEEQNPVASRIRLR